MTDYTVAKRYISKAKNARSAGHSFGLTLAQFKRLMNSKRCAYSGLVLNDEDSNSFLYRSVDRIDNSIGYESGNVVSICQGVNKFKGNLENPEMTLDIKSATKIMREIGKRLK